MAINQFFCNQAKLDYLNGNVSGTDTFKLALFTSAATLDSGTTVYSSANEAIGAGYTAGGLTLAGYSSSLVAGVANVTWTNPTIATASLTARGAMIWNSTRASRSVAILDFGADYTATSGSFTVNLPAAGATAVIRIS